MDTMSFIFGAVSALGAEFTLFFISALIYGIRRGSKDRDADTDTE